jgi:hypothetical protein
MQLETNIKNIQKIAKLKENENLSFHNFLKGQDSDKIDAIVHRLNEEVTPQIDCLECGNCCMNLRPIATNEEVGKYAEEKDIEDVKYLMSFPCKYLDDKKCTIYLDRYEECRSYPYLDKNKFVTRINGVLQNYEMCPIVFNVFELLKIEIGWKYK